MLNAEVIRVLIAWNIKGTDCRGLGGALTAGVLMSTDNTESKGHWLQRI